MVHTYDQWALWPITRPVDNALMGVLVFLRVTSDGSAANPYATFPDTPTRMQELGAMLGNRPIRVRYLSVTMNTVTSATRFYWGVRNKVHDLMFAIGNSIVGAPGDIVDIDIGSHGAILQPDWANFDATNYWSHIAMDPVPTSGEIFKVTMQLELVDPAMGVQPRHLTGSNPNAVVTATAPTATTWDYIGSSPAVRK